LIRNAIMTTIPTTNTALKSTAQVPPPRLLCRVVVDVIIVIVEISDCEADSAGISMVTCERLAGTGTRRGMVSGHVMVLVSSTEGAGPDMRSTGGTGAARDAVRVRVKVSSEGVRVGIERA
jgi:hypothetical protein